MLFNDSRITVLLVVSTNVCLRVCEHVNMFIIPQFSGCQAKICCCCVSFRLHFDYVVPKISNEYQSLDAKNGSFRL
jgi:hypothetical protein